MSFLPLNKADSKEALNLSDKGKIPQVEKNVNAAILQSDELFQIGKFKESYDVLLEYQDTENVEVLWRLSRGLYNITKQKTTDKSTKATLIKEAFEHIDKALRLDDKHNAVHKWMAILVDAKSSLEGIKSRINTLPTFKKHLMTAIELNPKDATSMYMLGLYMYNIADMSWLQVKIAKALFGTPPEASFEEAFQYFSKAEEVEPNFYSANLLMLGKTCLKLKRLETAQYWLKCATSYPVRTDEDEAVRLEAEDLLKKNPIVMSK
ncbi:protein FAM82B, putative [Pediculus humanus corporis]|uniref:Regulator of microtubule dynamics protein 1 n=1 Tax=Pediculus humanus subsp. corporis TaxID=121224 RepID=E0VH29_PEDHC|nr:protein FAM82B, putative [Pediculus humanus corporis]EEB12685.1 protein FAM82B, putative [Pediculus humanus corporis]